MSSNPILPSETVKFVVKNVTSNPARTIKIFNQKIGPGRSYDLMKIPGVTEEDIRAELTKGYLKQLVSRQALLIESSTVNLKSLDAAQTSFLSSVSVPTSDIVPSYLTQTAWYVDPTNGSDANDGLTSGTAIKTVAELSRRWGKGNLLSPAGANGVSAVTITVNILANVPNTDPLNIDIVLDGNVRLVFLGGVSATSALTVSSVTTRNRATNAPYQFTVSSGTVSVMQRILASGPGVSAAYFWTVRDLTGGAWRLSEPCTKPSLGSLLADANQVGIGATGDGYTFEAQTLYTLKLGSIKVMQVRNSAAGAPFGNSLMFRDLDLTGDYCPELSSNTSSFVYECKFSRSITPSTGLFTNLQNCGQPTGQLIRPVGGLVRFGAGGYIGSGSAFAPTTSALQFSNDVIWQSTSLSIVGSNVLAITGGVGIFDSVAGGNGSSNLAGNGLMCQGESSVTVRTTITNAVWGSGQLGGGIGVAAGSNFFIVNDASTPSITGSTPGTNDFVLGGATSTYGINADGTFVGPTTNSWANFAAAIGAGTGHGRHATNPQKKASILKTE